MDGRLLPEPDRELGYSENRLASILGERMTEFRAYMEMKTHALDDGSAVYYPSDVHWFVEHHVPPRAAPLTEEAIDAIFQNRSRD